MSKAALIVAYARVENILSLIDQLAMQRVSRIYLSIDGPLTTHIVDLQTRLRLSLEEKKKQFSGEIFVWQREANLGSGAAVIASLDWAFSCESQLYILEDDLMLGFDFFKFMDFGLDSMEIDSNLLMVTGTNPFELESAGKLGKINYPVSWGWATNRQNWIKLRDLIFAKTSEHILREGVPRTVFWRIGKRRSLAGKIDAWDIPLASEMYKTPYFTLVPPSNLVRNIGFDGHAVHTSESIWPLNLPISKISEMENLKYKREELINLNDKFENRIFRIRKRHFLSWLTYRFTDTFRFKGERVSLSDRIQESGNPPA